MEPNPTTVAPAEFIAFREVTLEIDGSEEELGAKRPIQVSEDAPVVHAKDFLKWGVRVDVAGIRQGTFNSHPACLLVLNFQFLFPATIDSLNRFSKADLTASFHPVGGAATLDERPRRRVRKPSPDGAERPTPRLRLLSPKEIRGPATRVTVSSSLEISAGVRAPGVASLVQPEAGIAASVGVEYVQNHELKILGRKWTSKGARDFNGGCWSLVENSSQGDGIPPALRTALVVEHGGVPIEGTIKIHARTKMGLSLFGWPWSGKCPIAISPDLEYGAVTKISEFNTLGDEDWSRLCQFDGKIIDCQWCG